MDDEDYDIDDILNNYSKKKKKKHPGRKGRRGERELIDILSKRFPGKPFSRTMGSGNRWAQANLSDTAKKVFTGDICCPDDFLFVLESKNGYKEINLDLAIERFKKTNGEKGNVKLDEFLEQSTKDGKRIGKMPMLCWKRDYKPWVVFLKKENTPEDLQNLEETEMYREWFIMPLSKVLEKPDNFFLASQSQ